MNAKNDKIDKIPEYMIIFSDWVVGIFTALRKDRQIFKQQVRFYLFFKRRLANEKNHLNSDHCCFFGGLHG